MGGIRSAPTYIYRHTSSYIVRITIPPDIVPAIGKKEFRYPRASASDQRTLLPKVGYSTPAGLNFPFNFPVSGTLNPAFMFILPVVSGKLHLCVPTGASGMSVGRYQKGSRSVGYCIDVGAWGEACVHDVKVGLQKFLSVLTESLKSLGEPNEVGPHASIHVFRFFIHKGP